MDVVTGWTGHAACALQAALRMSNEAFAEHLGIAVRTVAAWHQKPGLRPRPEMQQVLDAALTRAPAAAGDRFAVLTGGPARAVTARATPAMRPCRSRGLAAVARGGVGDECAAALQHDQPSLSG